jgi:hypothetical protein
MKSITNRMRKLENRLVPCESEESRKVSFLVAQIRERRRLRLEREGRPVEEERPREDLRGLTLAQAIRNCRSAALERMTRPLATER